MGMFLLLDPSIFTQEVELPEPEIAITLPKIPKLSLSSDFENWVGIVQNRLRDLELDGLVDLSRPKPTTLSRPLSSAWIFWSLTIRKWLDEHLDQDLAAYIRRLPNQPIYADDLWKEINKLLLPNHPGLNAIKATRNFFSMKRSDFTSPARYIHAWYRLILVCNNLRLGITPYMAILRLLDQLEGDLPDTIKSMRADMERKGEETMWLEESEYFDLVIRLLSEAMNKVPLIGTRYKCDNHPKRVGPSRNHRKSSYHIKKSTLKSKRNVLFRRFNHNPAQAISTHPDQKQQGVHRVQNRELQPANNSRLLNLPGELRNMVYDYLFVSTRLTFAERRIGDRFMATKPAPNSLAILRTCRQINRETQGLWLNRVLFNFDTICTMLDKLSTLPEGTVSEIRYLRVSAERVTFTRVGYHGGGHHFDFCLNNAFTLIPCLHLNRLTVFGEKQGRNAHEALEILIQRGVGWKELHYITPNSEILAWLMAGYDQEQYAQPSHWNQVLHHRDGKDSGASVTIYRSTKLQSPGSVMDPNSRETFEKPARTSVHEQPNVKSFCPEGGKHKESMVIVKRGNTPDILTKNMPPNPDEYESGRHWIDDQVWAKIRRQSYEACSWWSEEGILETEVDQYHDVEEYSWTDPAY